MNLALIHANQTALRVSQETIQRQRNLQKLKTSDDNKVVKKSKSKEVLRK